MFVFNISGVLGRGDRVEAPGIERMAATDAARGEPAALERAVRADRLEGVMRAARMETAAFAEPRAQRELIAADEAADHVSGESHASFRRRFVRLSRSCALCAEAAPLRAPTIKSSAGSSAL